MDKLVCAVLNDKPDYESFVREIDYTGCALCFWYTTKTLLIRVIRSLLVLWTKTINNGKCFHLFELYYSKQWLQCLFTELYIICNPYMYGFITRITCNVYSPDSHRICILHIMHKQIIIQLSSDWQWCLRGLLENSYKPHK